MQFFLNEQWITVDCNGKKEDFPIDWVENNKLDTLSNICKVKGGKAFQAKKFLTSGFGKVIKIKNVGFGTIRYDNLSYISKNEAEHSSDFLLNPSDIIISMTGSSFNAPNSMVGRVAIVNKEDNNCYMNQRVGSLKFSQTVSKKYWFYFMSLKKNQHFLVKNATGAANQVNISNDLIESINIPFISLQEQTEIANVLSKQEAIVKNIQEILQQIERRNNVMINDLLSGNLRIKEENGTLILYKNSIENWKTVTINKKEVQIPSDWNISNFKKESNILKDKYIDNLQYLEIGDINIFTKKYNIENKEKTKAAAMKFVPKNTLLISTVRPTRLAFTITNEDLNVSSAFVRLKSKIQNYLYFVLFTDNYFKFVESNQTGATYPTIKEDTLLDFEFGLPNADEITNIYNLLNKFNEEKNAYQNMLKVEENIFNFLLEELMSGRLRVKI